MADEKAAEPTLGSSGDGIHRASTDACDLRNRVAVEPLHVLELHHQTLGRVQFRQRRLELWIIAEPVVILIELLGQIGAGGDRTTLATTELIGTGEPDAGVQPGLEAPPLVRRTTGPDQLQERLLDGIFGLLPIFEQPIGTAEEPVGDEGMELVVGLGDPGLQVGEEDIDLVGDRRGIGPGARRSRRPGPSSLATAAGHQSAILGPANPLVNVRHVGAGAVSVRRPSAERAVDDGPSLDFTDPMLSTITRRIKPLLRPELRFFLALLAIDMVFLALHASHVRYDRPGSGMWLISRDRGFPEIWQYVKEAAIVALLLTCYRRRRSPVTLAWAVAFAYFLVDDSLEIHETLGDVLAAALDLGTPFGIEGRDVGQILVSGSVGLVLVIAVAVTTMTDRSPDRALTMRLLPVLAAIGFFGVVADVIDVIDVLGLVEDGGEMAAMSAGLAIVADHWRRLDRGAALRSVSGGAPGVTGKSAQPIESPDPSTS